MRSLFLLAVLSFISLQSSAYQVKEGNVSAALGPFFYKTNYEGRTDEVKSSYLGSPALLVQGDVNEHGSLEITLFQMNKMFFRDQDGGFLAEQTPVMQIGLGYRRWLNEYFSVGWAFYSSYAMADPTVVHSVQGSGNQLDTSASDITEYGFDFSVQSEIWSRDRLAVILDARYARPVTSKENEHGDHYGLLVALRYFVQSRQ
jgi:hypothetical protein